MLLLRLPLLDKFIYINASKILFFESTKTGFTELHLESGESFNIPMTPEDLANFISQPYENDDSILLNPSEVGAMFERS